MFGNSYLNQLSCFNFFFCWFKPKSWQRSRNSSDWMRERPENICITAYILCNYLHIHNTLSAVHQYPSVPCDHSLQNSSFCAPNGIFWCNCNLYTFDVSQFLIIFTLENFLRLYFFFICATSTVCRWTVALLVLTFYRILLNIQSDL